MIGDKFLTDGLFALRIDATPILLERRVHVADSFFIRVVNAVDDLAYYVWKLFQRLKN